MKQGISGLTHRESQAYHNSMFELTPKNIAKWVKNLPVANLDESSKKIYHLIVDINQTLIDPSTRLVILNTVEPITNQLIMALEKQFPPKNVSLTEKQKKAARLIQAIQTELSIAYHAIIESLLANEIKRSQAKILTTAIAMALKYHGLVILECYQLYTSVPNRIWRELYNLYQIAQSHYLEHKKITVSHCGEKCSITRSFIRILLLSTANPYQLRQQDIRLLWNILPEICQHVSLTTRTDELQHFVIPLNHSVPTQPIHSSLAQSLTDKNNLKITPITAINHLKQMLIDNKNMDQHHNQRNMLLKHLITCWGNQPQRSFARISCNNELEISIGLSATHYQLVQAKKNNATVKDRRNSFNINEPLVDTQSPFDVTANQWQGANNFRSSASDNILTKLYSSPLDIKKAANSINSNRKSKKAIAKESYQSKKAQIIDISPDGYCLQMASELLPKHAQTGDILGFLEPEHTTTTNWQIAVIRWVKRLSKGTIIQMGVQLLASGARPINIQLRNSKSASNEYLKALILPAIKSTGQSATLVSNALSFDTNSKIRIIDGDAKYDARLSKLANFTTSMKQFYFEKVKNENGENNKNEKRSLLKDPSFDDLEIDTSWDDPHPF